MNRKIRACILIICVLSYSKNTYSLEEISTEGLSELNFGKVPNTYDSLPTYKTTIHLKIMLKYNNLLSKKVIEPIPYETEAKISVLPNGVVKSIKFMNFDIKKQTEDDVRDLIDRASPFNEFPNKLAKIADIYEFTLTFNNTKEKQSNKALHGINP